MITAYRLRPEIDHLGPPTFILFHKLPPTTAALDTLLSFSRCSGHLRLARAAPVVAGELVGLMDVRQADDPVVELIGTAYGGLYSGPALSKLVFA